MSGKAATARVGRLLPGDVRHLLAAVALSRAASERGDEPYAAVLADKRGRVLAKAQNTQNSARDCTGHAELNLLREATPRLGRKALSGCTVFASGEPCPMCAGAIFWAGIRRVVFGLDIASMYRLAGKGADELLLSCREVFRHGTRRVAVVGPALADEAAAVLKAHYRRNGGKR